MLPCLISEKTKPLFSIVLHVFIFLYLLERSKDAYLIQGILFLFNTKFTHFNLKI